MKRSLQLNPDNQPATIADIKEWRNTHEISPISTSFGTFDVDPISNERMIRAIRNWQHIETLNENGEVAWVLADNSVVWLSESDLGNVWNTVEVELTSRASVLHDKTLIFVAQDPKPLLGDIKDINFWLT